MVRQVSIYKTYFIDFYQAQEDKVQEKIEYVLDLVRYQERVPTKFLKKMVGTDGLYEIRVKQGSNIYRIFCFFDEGKLVLLLNGFVKKTQKTPKKEIRKAEQLKAEYYESKRK